MQVGRLRQHVLALCRLIAAQWAGLSLAVQPAILQGYA
jgi:hypothetical protein